MSFTDISMATLLLKTYRNEKHSAIHFLWAKEIVANAIHS